jgi:hypothetical protein
VQPLVVQAGSVSMPAWGHAVDAAVAVGITFGSVELYVPGPCGVGGHVVERNRSQSVRTRSPRGSFNGAPTAGSSGSVGRRTCEWEVAVPGSTK